MRRLAVIFCALLISFAAAAPAWAGPEEVAPGVQYAGEKRLAVARLGTSFAVPAGWVGTIPAGEDYFVITRAQEDGYVVLIADAMSKPQATQAMSAQIPIAGLVLNPTTPVSEVGGKLKAKYDVFGAGVPLQATATAVIGKHGFGVVVLAAGSAESLPTYQKLAASVEASLKLKAPSTPPKPKGAPKGFWAGELGGQRVVRFFHGSGYSEKQQIFLCPNGQFAYSFNSGGADLASGFSGAAQSKNGGAWTASGGPAGGRLDLRYNDGRTSAYQLRLDGSKLMLDDQRWLREAIRCP